MQNQPRYAGAGQKTTNLIKETPGESLREAALPGDAEQGVCLDPSMIRMVPSEDCGDPGEAFPAINDWATGEAQARCRRLYIRAEIVQRHCS